MAFGRKIPPAFQQPVPAPPSTPGANLAGPAPSLPVGPPAQIVPPQFANKGKKKGKHMFSKHPVSKGSFKV